MIYFADIYTNPVTVDKEARLETHRKLRGLAAQLISDTYAINGYWLLSLLRLIPPRKQVNEATSKLIGWSTPSFQEDFSKIDEWRKDVSALLRLRIFG